MTAVKDARARAIVITPMGYRILAAVARGKYKFATPATRKRNAKGQDLP